MKEIDDPRSPHGLDGMNEVMVGIVRGPITLEAIHPIKQG
jgi:hypothetical protein